MGITVHMNLGIYHIINVKEKIIDELARYSVITFSSGLFEKERLW